MESQGQPGLLGKTLSEKQNKQNKKWVSRIKCQQPYLRGLALDYREGNVAGKDVGPVGCWPEKVSNRWWLCVLRTIPSNQPALV